MPKYNFSWDAFDHETVKELATAYGFDPAATGDDPRAWLAENVKRPNDVFVREVLSRLLDSPWFCNFRGLAGIVAQLQDWEIGPMGTPRRSQKECIQYVRECHNRKTLRRILCQAVIDFGEVGDPDPDEDGVGLRKVATLMPGKQPRDHREAHPYQKEAWDRLSAKLAESQATGIFQGLLVMPTGSGKTFTAVRWLVENVLNRGRGRIR